MAHKPGSATRNGTVSGTDTDQQSHNGSTQTFGLSIVVPTRNEAGNVAVLVGRIEQAITALPLAHLPVEVIFVDDSDDDTPAAIQDIRSSVQVRLIHRDEAGRNGGLSGAVVEGMRAARSEWVCVMDGDLQHPPEALANMTRAAMSADADVVVASRFCGGGDVGTFSRLRTMMSRACSGAAALMFQRHLRNVTDPLSGFFMVRRDAVELDLLQPQGFKILLEILIRTPGLRVSEVPFRFGERHSGDTKASTREAMRFVSQLARLRLGDLPVRFSRFGIVGATGLAVNMVLLALLTDVAGMYYVAGAVLATQGSTLWNYCLTELWVFHDREHRRSGASRMAMFFGVNNAALVLRVPLLFALTSGLGVNYLVSNFLSLICLTVVRYALADTWIWAGGKRDGTLICYDIHGIVTVASEVALPELERFKVDELLDEPKILVRIGDAKPVPQNGFNGGWTSDGLAGVISEGVAADEITRLASENGNGHAATAPLAPNGGIETPAWASNGNGHAPHTNGNGHAPLANGNGADSPALHAIHYAETFGRYGFAVEIEDIGGRFEIMASPLVGRSPHVLYTNVVEPVLRWTLAETGHALVHAACYAQGERAFMITARTDTGKTTTMLKILDASPDHSFVSDDLTIVCPDGRVLAYPKPLTISRHTVQAVSTPLLSRAERIGLVVQSRLHSRSGRRFAMLIAKLRIPAATLNAVTQIVVPPPKYHVDRLVPEAKVAPEAKLTALAIIQRGGVGDVKLEHEEAMDILLSNCEDAYGFPPYSNIERFLHSRNGSDLKQVERDIISRAFQDVPATLVRSETMDWWQRVPAVVNGNGTAASEKDELSALGR